MWRARINEHVELCAGRSDSNSFQQLKERKSKLLTENEMAHLVQKSYFCQTLSVEIVGVATVNNCCTVHVQNS